MKTELWGIGAGVICTTGVPGFLLLDLSRGVSLPLSAAKARFIFEDTTKAVCFFTFFFGCYLP